jgi:hypothetical protein
VRAVIVVAAEAVLRTFGSTPQRSRLVRANARSSSALGKEMVSEIEEIEVLIAGVAMTTSSPPTTQ